MSSIVCNSRSSADTLDDSRSLRILLIHDQSKLFQIAAEKDFSSDDVTVAGTVLEALDIAAKIDFDIVVLGVSDGAVQLQEDVSQIKSGLASLPLVVLARSDDENVANVSIDLGAQDCFYKPIDNYSAIRRRMLYAIARHASSEADQQTIRQLQATSQLDSLTGLFNRAAFKRESARQLAIAKRNGTPLSIAMIDVDFFKTINDKYGHMVGDDVLVGLASLFENVSRVTDIAYRYGGEEFCFILPDTDEEQSYVRANRLCRTVREVKLDTRQGPLSITISIGTATLAPGASSIDEALERADAGCIEAKNRGRDQVVVATRENLADNSKTGKHNPLLENVRACDVMSTILLTVPESTTIGQASRMMLECQSEVIPVLASSGKLSGLITNEEIVSHVLRGGNWEDTVDSIAGQTVSFPEDTLFNQIWAMFQRLPIRRAVVTRDEKPVGIVNRGQLLRRLAAQLELKETETQLSVEHLMSSRQILSEVKRTAEGCLLTLGEHKANDEQDFSILVAATQLQELASQLLQVSSPAPAHVTGLATCSAAALTNL